MVIHSVECGIHVVVVVYPASNAMHQHLYSIYISKMVANLQIFISRKESHDQNMKKKRKRKQKQKQKQKQKHTHTLPKEFFNKKVYKDEYFTLLKKKSEKKKIRLKTSGQNIFCHNPKMLARADFNLFHQKNS